jgi:hypothetical protein
MRKSAHRVTENLISGDPRPSQKTIVGIPGALLDCFQTIISVLEPVYRETIAMKELTCRKASLLVVGAFAAVEVSAILAPSACSWPWLLSAVRLLLMLVWARCYDVKGAGWGALVSGPARHNVSGCGGGGVPASLSLPAGKAQPAVRTWRAAGASLPGLELAMNLIKSRRWALVQGLGLVDFSSAWLVLGSHLL